MQEGDRTTVWASSDTMIGEGVVREGLTALTIHGDEPATAVSAGVAPETVHLRRQRSQPVHQPQSQHRRQYPSSVRFYGETMRLGFIPRLTSPSKGLHKYEIYMTMVVRKARAFSGKDISTLEVALM